MKVEFDNNIREGRSFQCFGESTTVDGEMIRGSEDPNPQGVNPVAKEAADLQL